MSGEIENGKIVSTTLGGCDHGIFTAYLEMDFGGSGQSFGGYSLDAPPAERRAGAKRQPTAAGMGFITETMRVLEVEKWESLKGTYCRVRRDQPLGPIVAIGHILKDQWFCPSDYFRSMGVR